MDILHSLVSTQHLNGFYMVFEVIDYNFFFFKEPVTRTLFTIRIGDSLKNFPKIIEHYPIKTNSITSFLEIYLRGLDFKFKNLSHTPFYTITHLGYINLINESYVDFISNELFEPDT